MPSPVTVPVVTVQPTLGEVVQDVNEGLVSNDKFWVSCYKTSEPSIHTKINVELDERDRDLLRLSSEDESLKFEFVGDGKKNRGYRFSSSALGLSNVRLLTPCQEYVDPDKSNPQNPKGIEAFDVSPDGSRYATGFMDGSVQIHPTSALQSSHAFLPQRITATGSKVHARPHVSNVTTLRFFPSSRVLLTSGLDFSLSILPADLPDTPNSSVPKTVESVRTLRGHKRAVTSTAIIGVGRNVLSASLDSTIKLWEVPSGVPITSWSTSSPILTTSMGQRSSELEVAHTSAGEVHDVQSNIVFAGLQDGTFELFDLASKRSTYRSQAPTQSQQLTSIAYSDQNRLVATGSNTGLISIYDIRSLDSPLFSFVRQNGEILDLTVLPRVASSEFPLGLAVATSDGLPFVATIEADGAISADELVGVDCDPVRQIRVRAEQGSRREIWMSSDDSVVRRYVYQE